MNAFNFKATQFDSHKTVIGKIKDEAQPCFPRAIKKAIGKLDVSIAQARGRWIEGPALSPAMKSQNFTFHKASEEHESLDVVDVFLKIGIAKVPGINEFDVKNEKTEEVEHKSLDYFRIKKTAQMGVGEMVIATLEEFKAFLESLSHGDNPVIDEMCKDACKPKQKIDKDNAPQKSYEESSDTWIDVGYEQKWDESTEEWVRATNLKEVV